MPAVRPASRSIAVVAAYLASTLVLARPAVQDAHGRASSCLDGARHALDGQTAVYMVGTTKTRQQCAQRHATHNHPANLRRGFRRQRRLPSASGKAPSTMAKVVIRIGRRRWRRCLHDQHPRVISHAIFPQVICELDDQDAVFCDQAHQRDQSDLRIHVQRSARTTSTPAGLRSSTGAPTTKSPCGSTKAFELGGKHQER